MRQNDTITEVRISGVRSLKNVVLRLDKLNVLIGDNGTGKSTILECLEILRKSAGSAPIIDELAKIHGGLFDLLREGDQSIGLGVVIDGPQGKIDYSFKFGVEGDFLVVREESLDWWNPSSKSGPETVISRSASRTVFADRSTGVRMEHRLSNMKADRLIAQSRLSTSLYPPVVRVLNALAGIHVHLPFEVRPRWVCRERRWASLLREPVQLDQAVALDRLGENLVNCFHRLRMEFPAEHWEQTMDIVRLGLGSDVVSVNTRSVPGGGYIALSLELRGFKEQIPASRLSDGTLSYLSFVAIQRLSGGRSLLAIDEPEAHLHPGLMGQVLSLLESVSLEHPVVLATHSDRLLDGLESPQNSVVLCRLDEERSTQLDRPKPKQFEKWLKEFRGIGGVRRMGLDEMAVRDGG